MSGQSSGAHKDFPLPSTPWFDKDGRPLPFVYEFLRALWLRSGGPTAPSGSTSIGITYVNEVAAQAQTTADDAIGLGLFGLFSEDATFITINQENGGSGDSAIAFSDDGGGATTGVTSVTAGAGLTTKLGTIDGSILSLGTISVIEPPKHQTGTVYTVADGDQGGLLTFSNTANVTVTFPQAGAASSFLSNWFVDLEDINTGQVTIVPTTSKIDGNTSLVVKQNQGVRIVSDGTNYFTQRGMGLWSASPVSNIGTSLAINSGTIDLQTIAATGLFGNSTTNAAIPTYVTVGNGLSLSSSGTVFATGSGGGGGPQPTLLANVISSSISQSATATAIKGNYFTVNSDLDLTDVIFPYNTITTGGTYIAWVATINAGKTVTAVLNSSTIIPAASFTSPGILHFNFGSPVGMTLGNTYALVTGRIDNGTTFALPVFTFAPGVTLFFALPLMLVNSGTVSGSEITLAGTTLAAGSVFNTPGGLIVMSALGDIL